jgi:hypothetical protein
MAIEKTVFSGLTVAARGAEIVAWLTANGSEFFDSVEMTSDGIAVVCYKGDKMALLICLSGSSNKTKVYAANGAFSEAAMYSSQDWDYGIKTSKGLLIYYNNSQQPGCVAVVKTNEGGTFIARRYQGWCAADFDNSAAIESYVATGTPWNHQSDMTVLAPIVASHANTYADGLYLQLFAQYPNTDSILTVDGKKYYSDGVFALEE